MCGNMSVTHQKDQNGESKYWRVALPNSSEIRRLAVTKLHEIAFMDHLNVRKFKVWNSFYWKAIVGDIREFVKACTEC